MTRTTPLSQLVSTILLAGSCVFAVAPSKAQQATEPTDHTLRGQYHTGWTIREGVPGSIWDIAQDDDGFIWLGTASGLYRFDGVKFERFTPPNGQRLVGGPDASIVSLLAPRKGGLWVGFQFGGASFIKGGAVTNYPPRDVLSHSVNMLAEDAEGTIWGRTPLGLVHFDRGQWSNAGVDWGLPLGAPFYLRGDNAGGIWASIDDKFFVLRPGAKRFEFTGLTDGSLSVQRDPNGRIWCEYGDNYLNELKPKANGTWEVKKTAFQQKLLDFTITPDNSLWIGGDGDGVSRIKGPVPPSQKPPPTFPFETFRHGDGLTDDTVFRVIQDREGGIWTVSTRGLDHFRPTILTAVSLPQQLKILAMASDGDTLIIGSSFSGELPMMRLSHDRLNPWPGSPIKAGIITVAPDGTTWISSKQDIWHAVNNKFIRVPGPKEFAVSKSPVLSMVAGESGDLWVSTLGDTPNRIFHLTAAGWKGFNKGPGRPYKLARDKKGQIWIGFKDNAIVVTGPNGDKTYGGAD
jgi:ligand-binding sensor domain-containing protein